MPAARIVQLGMSASFRASSSTAPCDPGRGGHPDGSEHPSPHSACGCHGARYIGDVAADGIPRIVQGFENRGAAWRRHSRQTNPLKTLADVCVELFQPADRAFVVGQQVA